MEHQVPCEGARKEEDTPSVSSSPDSHSGTAPEEAAPWEPEVAARPVESEGEEAGEGAAEQEGEHSPKAGRRRRRRRRRGAAAAAALTRDSSDDESPLSQESASTASGASTSRNVVTWSDLGGDSVLKKALPVGRVVQSSAPPPPPQQPPACASVVMPVSFQAAGAPPQTWPVPWAYTPGLLQPHGLPCLVGVPLRAGAPAAPCAYEPTSRWTEKDTIELRQWLCKGFSGGMPGLSELAHVLQSVATDAYED